MGCRVPAAHPQTEIPKAPPPRGGLVYRLSYDSLFVIDRDVSTANYWSSSAAMVSIYLPRIRLTPPLISFKTRYILKGPYDRSKYLCSCIKRISLFVC